MRRRLLVPVVAALTALGLAVPSPAETKYDTAVDTMPDNQYRLCVSRNVDQVGLLGVAGNFTVPEKSKRVKVTIVVAGMGDSAPTIDLAIEANTTVTTDSLLRWTNIPDDNVVLTTASVTPSVAVINGCLPGEFFTVEFPKTSEWLVPGQIYWLVLRNAVGSTGTTIWYAAQESQIGTATTSQYGNWSGVWGWGSWVPGLYFPNAFRAEVR